MALREILADLGFNVDQKALDGADKRIEGIKKKFIALGAVVAQGLVVRGVANFVAGQAAIADNAFKASQSLGLQTRSLVQWQEIVRAAGGDGEQFTKGLQNLAKQVRDANDGGQKQIQAFKDLGVQLKTGTGEMRAFDDILADTVVGFAEVEDTTRRTAIAQEFFAEAGQSVIRVSLDGADAIQKQREAFNRLNPDFDRFLELSKENAVAFDGWNNATDALKRTITTALLPALTSVVRFATRVIEGFQELAANTNIVRASVLVLVSVFIAAGLAITVAFAGPIALFLGFAAIIAALILIVDDVITLFEGGESVIGAWVDEIFGAGKAAEVVKGLSAILDGQVDIWGSIGFAIRSVFTDLGANILGGKQAIRDFANATSKAFDVAGGVITDAFDVVVDFVTTQLDRVAAAFRRIVETLREAVQSITSIGQDALDFLGIGFEGDQPTPPLDPDTAREFFNTIGAGAFLSPPATSGQNSVRINQPVTVNVSGAGDPVAVGAQVAEKVQDVQRDQLREARDLATGM